MLVFSYTYFDRKIISDPIRLLEGQVYLFCSATILPRSRPIDTGIRHRARRSSRHLFRRHR